jgi:hypothetical protein
LAACRALLRQRIRIERPERSPAADRSPLGLLLSRGLPDTREDTASRASAHALAPVDLQLRFDGEISAKQFADGPALQRLTQRVRSLTSLEPGCPF